MSKSKNFYSIVAPGTIRPYSEYAVFVSVHESEAPINFKIGIEGEKYSDFKHLELQPHSSDIIKFDAPALVPGEEYKLTAEGKGAIEFKNSSNLIVNNDHLSIFLQSDKALYKPGDLVQFRVLFLDENTRPAVIDGNIDVTIEDSNQNQIKVFKNVEPINGVFSGELQLSQFPVYGTWSINVKVNPKFKSTVEKTKTFDVEEYVLPKFEVIVETGKNNYADDGKLRAIVRAKYTYGKPVKGEATVTVKERSYHYFNRNPQSENIVEKVVPIDGKASVEFDMADILKDHKYDYQATMQAVVEEKLTGHKLNGSSDFTIYKDRYDITRVDDSKTTDGPMNITLKITERDGTPVQDTVNPVQISVRHSYRGTDESFFNASVNLDKNGLTTFTVPVNNSDEGYNQLTATYMGVSRDIYLHRYYPFIPQESTEKLDANIKSEQPHKLDKDVEIEVVSKEDMNYLIYQVVGRGKILMTEHEKFPTTKRHTLKFKPTFEMVPTATIFVHLVHNGDLLFTEKTINVEDILPNHIDLSTADESKPGEDVDIKIKTTPNSYVGLLGIDQSVLLLSPSGSDLSKNDVINDLRKYQSRVDAPYGYGKHPGRDSGLIAMTNAHFENPRLFPAIYLMFSNRGGQVGVPPVPLAAEGLGGAIHDPIVTRKEFPETWIWDYSQSNNTNGEMTLHKKVPDTITSWVLTGFSLHPEKGLGLTDTATKLRVFQPFFASLNLPYSVKRGEVFSVPVIVFNYMDKDLDTDVTLDNAANEFEFTEATNEIEENPKHELNRTKRVTVPAQSGEVVSFMVRPKIVGHMKLKATAVSPLAGDALENILPVEPEGVTEYVNKAVLLDATNGQKSAEIPIEIPENAVPDSTHIEVSAVGDLLGPTIKNLDKLVRMPYGCGEQNMVNFVPNILVMDYLTKNNQLTPEIETKAKKFMEVGYQRELTYKHKDGSYSAFGESDGKGSTWLTAYVLRSFIQAQKFITIDPNIIESAAKFIVSHQAENGSFPEVGRVIDKHFGGSDNDVALTAFTTLALLEDPELMLKYADNINKALQYIKENIDPEGDVYTLALATYALQVANDRDKDTYMQKLEARATVKGDRKWWDKPTPKEDHYFFPQGNIVNIQPTAYALLTLLQNNKVEESLPVLKWLISKRNSNGGFDSTQDTVVGLQALIGFAGKVGNTGSDLDLNISYDNESAQMKVNADNRLLLQSREIPSSVRNVKINAEGKGSAMAQVSYRYNMKDTKSTPGFILKPTVDAKSTSDHIVVNVCTSYTQQDPNEPKDSNMAVMEVSLPSGFTADSESFKNIEAIPSVKKIETKNADTVVVIYFESLNSKEVCPTVSAFKTHKVAKQKPAPVIVYDYYDNAHQAREFYEAPESSLCDICEGEDCGTGCKPK